MPSTPFQLDKLDAAIVALLQEDGRRPYGEIGEAVGLSEAAARQRVNRLRESGLMRIVAVTDPVALGRGVVATVGLRVSGDSRVVAARLAQIAEVEYVVVTAGAFDVLAELVCASEDELLDVLNEDIRTIPEVGEMQILMHLRTEKNVFAWGQRPSEE